MKTLCVVPARGGSKRCPRKNIALLGDMPLINWTLRTVKECHDLFDRVVVSTEDEEIGTIANEYYGSDIFWRRPSRLAMDETPMLPVVLDVFHSFDADVVVTLQPTSPFRTAADVRAAHELLLKTKADAVFSTTEAPVDLVFEVGHAHRLRSVKNIVVPNGALFLITGDALRRGESWFSGLTYGYPMSKDSSLDIDTQLDLDIARMIVDRADGTTGC